MDLFILPSNNCNTNMLSIRSFVLALIVFVLFMSCKVGPEATLFNFLPAESTGIHFINEITESDSFNILTEEYIFNGGGVAVADFNNDGLPDLFFSGNQVGNKLYLNQGNLKFKDVTEASGVAALEKWSTGAAVVDINYDGLPDLYICANIHENPSRRSNMLFVNQGLDEDGVPVFIDKAKEYGLADEGHSINAVFFDYDLDGHLDLYVLNAVKGIGEPGTYRDKIIDGSANNNDQLYKNNGDGTFSNVTLESGITIEGFGLGVAIADFNKDGWPDIYVSNDYLSNDILYINNRDGTFTNQISELIRKQSMFSMGVDANDFNNDGWMDILTLDMFPESNYRKKTTINKFPYQTYTLNEQFGYEAQHIRNMLQLSNGEGVPFSEIGFMAGVYQTDWSWSPLFFDMDNDGFRDIMVTNGFPRDITDKDFSSYRKDVGRIAGPSLLLPLIPIVKIANYGFKNKGDLTYENISITWGLTHDSFSNGAAFVDLDNDGDLDYVVNNINDPAFVYENKTIQTGEQVNFIKLKLSGPKTNPYGIGAKVVIWYGGDKMQYHEHFLSRGYMSSIDPLIHFGLGEVGLIDKIEVYWQEGLYSSYEKLSVNQLIELSFEDAAYRDFQVLEFPFRPNQEMPLYKALDPSFGVAYRHQEDDKIDFNLQRTLPHKLSQYGPGLAVGDMNGNGLEDLIIGGSANYGPVAFLQQHDGTFLKISDPLGDITNQQEDLGLLLFDVDNDGDLDLYLVSGSIENEIGSKFYQDRLFLNDGKGNFDESNNLPEINASGTTVRAADFDGNGYLDLFVGGRAIPGQYPLADKSYLLKNTAGVLEDVTDVLAPGLKNVGMVTDAIWTDVDNDGKVDLMVVGEFMAITIFKNDGSQFTKLNDTGLEEHIGWWNSITAGDFNNNGLTDYVVGNLGSNNYYQVTPEKPLTVVAKDFDNNGSIDPILFAHFKNNEGKYEAFPVHFWDDLYGQSVMFRRQFKGYHQYGLASKHNLLSPVQLENAISLEATMMQSSFIENLGNGKFKFLALPMEAQVAPVNGLLTDDVDGDGYLDVIMVGNDYGNEVFAGRYDAFTGLILKGDGKGNFKALPSSQSGFLVPKDAKALVKLITENDQEILLASQNREDLKAFIQIPSKKYKYFYPASDDQYVIMKMNDGRKVKQEIYYGSGFLSQSSRKIKLPEELRHLTVVNYKGEVREILMVK